VSENYRQARASGGNPPMGKIQIPPRPIDYFCIIGSAGGAVLDRAQTAGGAWPCVTAAAITRAGHVTLCFCVRWCER
jgi:hypothetical protein